MKLLLWTGLAAFSISINAFAATVDVQKLQNKLDSHSAGWVAKDNWVNRLTLPEIKRMLGYPQRVRFGKEVSFYPRIDKATAGTDSVDWRNNNGKNWASPILNQGNCGSCVAYATIGTLETQMNISRNSPFLNLRFSTDALFACGGGRCDWGWMPSSAASFLKSTGVPDEACLPSTMSATGVDVACSMKCGDSAARSQKVTTVLTPANVDAVKAALKRGPLVTTVDVYSDFIVYSSGVYKHTTGDYLGGHAISIIGFDDARQAWIIRNSWGSDWGDHGFAYVAYDDTSGVGDSTWGFELPGVDGYAVAKNLHDHDFISGNYTVEAVSTYSNTTDLAFQVQGQDGTRASFSCKGTACPMALASTSLPDGRYEGVVQATHGGKQSASDKRYFYVMNHQPTMKVSFAAKDFDIKQPLKDRVEFNIDAASTPVPFSSMQLVVKQGDQVVYKKTADIVTPKMTMGWRTIFVPNGNYTIQLVGRVQTDSLSFETVSNSFDVSVAN